MEGLQQEQQRLQSLAVVKGAPTEEKEFSAKRHNDLPARLAALNIKLSPPAPWTILVTLFPLPVPQLFLPYFFNHSVTPKTLFSLDVCIYLLSMVILF